MLLGLEVGSPQMEVSQSFSLSLSGWLRGKNKVKEMLHPVLIHRSKDASKIVKITFTGAKPITRRALCFMANAKVCVCET